MQSTMVSVEHHRWVTDSTRDLSLSHLSLSLSPQGWNSWNHFSCNINEKLIQQTADIIVATGLAAAGYEYGVISHSSSSFHLPLL